MKKAPLSEFKAKLSKFIRLVKSGELVEIQERGVPVAILSSIQKQPRSLITPPRVDPKKLSKMKSSISVNREIDVVKILREDRNKR